MGWGVGNKLIMVKSINFMMNNNYRMKNISGLYVAVFLFLSIVYVNLFVLLVN